jgi:acid phosphatase (class A)
MKLTIAFTALVLLVAGAYSQSAPSAPAPAKTLKVLALADIDPSRLLPPPPKDNSDTQQRELAEVKRLVKERTPERIAQAVWDDAHEDPTAFATIIGPDFDLKKLPATARLLDEVVNDTNIAASAAKAFFRRRFPVAFDPSMYSDPKWVICDPADAKPANRPLRSYPSGHATMGYSLAIVLAVLIPEKSQAIQARAADYAYSRLVCADHYQSDVEASHALGSAVGTMLLNSAALKPDIDAAKVELRAAHLTK